MKVVHFIYNNQPVDFLSGEKNNLMVNATQMAKIFGKDVFQFTRIDDTKKFILACLKPQNCGLLDISTDEDLIISKQKSGTWMHRILALKFAAWLDPYFEVWVFQTIDTIVLGHYREHREATTEKLRTGQLVELKKKELMEKYPEFMEFLELEGRLTEADRRRNKAMREAEKQLKLELYPASIS